MSIERRYRLPARLTAVLLLAASLPVYAEQYRSKILVTPEGELGKGAELSIEELEQQIGSIQAPYARSSAGRHLARHYLQQGEYDKAIDYYQQALAAEGLSDVANREMLRELAQVYLVKGDYPAAARALDQALKLELVPEAADYLLLAQAYYRMKKYVNVVVTLDGIGERGLDLTPQQMHQAVALYYSAGAFAQCEGLLRRLLEIEPENPDNWHQLVSVYLQQNKRRQALDSLALAREKGVPFSEADVILLVDLHAVNENPYGAADILQRAIAANEVKGNAANYRKLFDLWFLARENERAQRALKQAARLSGDTELYLYLAQLLLEQRDWKALHETMLAACADPLEDRFVGKANVYLGISQLKLGDEAGARRSFINATLITGANVQAGQWLEYMGAGPATREEARRIVGICYGSEDKRLEVAGSGYAAPVTEESASRGSAGFEIRDIPSQRIFYRKFEMPLAELALKAQSLVTRMGVALVQAGGSVDGPLHIIAEGEAGEAGEPEWHLALPTSGSPQGRGQYRVRTAASCRCASLQAEGEGDALVEQWLQFRRDVQDAGYQLTGERRLVIAQTPDRKLSMEFQLGIE
jgi:tetratricopeptide (TPR) repeat protein